MGQTELEVFGRELVTRLIIQDWCPDGGLEVAILEEESKGDGRGERRGKGREGTEELQVLGAHLFVRTSTSPSRKASE